MRRIVFTSISFLWYIQSVFPVFGHPLDISNTTFTLYENSIEGVTYIHPVQLDRILVTRGDIAPTSITVDAYYSLTGILTQYLKETIMVRESGSECIMSNFSFQEELMIDEIFSRGFPISYRFDCNTKIAKPRVTIKFLTEVPLQTNKLNVYKSLPGGIFEKIDYSVLNIKKESLDISLYEKKMLKDSDNDGLSDEDEIIYGTNINLKDSDMDGYSDTEEIQNSWNPISKELGPMQKYRDTTEDNIRNITQGYNTLVPESSIRTSNTLTNTVPIWGGVQFINILRNIRLYIENHESGSGFIWLLFSIAGLGFVHALGPGHSKGILISQVLDKHIGVMKGTLYALIFSIVHILDIIVVVLISRYFFVYIDTSIALSYIQKGSVILILLVGIYLLRDSLSRYKGAGEVQTSKRQYVTLAIITGLTPCAFGWSIFLMLLATGRGDLAIPFLLALGFGIFLCLFLIMIFVSVFKRGIFFYMPKIGSISPILSSGFILFIGISLFFQNF